LKNDIVNVAKQILEDTGFESISMRNIAAELQVSATALYRHFPNKEAILDELVSSGFERLMKTLTTSLNESNAEKRLKACLVAYVSFGVSEFNQYSLMFKLNDYSFVPNRNKHKKFQQPVNRFMQDRVTDVLKLNKKRTINPVEFSAALWCFMHGAVLLYANQQIDFTQEEFDVFINLVLETRISELR